MFLLLRRRLTNTSLIAWSAGAVALGIGCYQLAQPHVLTGALGYNEGYDDGVYVAAATRLLHGVLPYRDFVLVHPPGIVYVLAPFVAIGSLSGSIWTLVLPRILTVLVTAANPVLAGLLVQRRGRIAVAASSFFLALWPLAVNVDRGVELEPYLVFFTFLGALSVFAAGTRPTARRLFLGGFLLGCSVVVKVWGILPVAAALLVLAPRWRDNFKWVAGGMASSILVFCVPLFAPSPGSFLHDVVFDQLHRQNTFGATSFADRLLLISGLQGLSAVHIAKGFAIAGFVLVVLAVAVTYGLARRKRSELDWFVLSMAAITFVGMFDAPVLFAHYAYFPAALASPLLGICASQIARSIRSLPCWTRSTNGAERRSRASAFLRPTFFGVVFLAGFTAFFVDQDVAFAHSYLGEASDPAVIASVIPPGACVVSDYPTDLIVANRLTPSKPGCPAVVDPFGMYLAEDNGSQPHLSPPPYRIQFVEQWFSILQHADYVELRIPYSDFIPWVPYMITWFSQNYRPVGQFVTVYPRGYIDSQKNEYVYQRIGTADS